MARRQTSAHDGNETRETLLKLAARTFGEQGYSATTMRNIAEQSGIEAASIYYHFASKEELVDEVMEQGGNRIISQQQERLAALGADATAEQRFRAAVLGQMAGLVKQDRKSTRLNSSHLVISYAVFCLKKKKNI